MLPNNRKEDRLLGVPKIKNLIKKWTSSRGIMGCFLALWYGFICRIRWFIILQRITEKFLNFSFSLELCVNLGNDFHSIKAL